MVNLSRRHFFALTLAGAVAAGIAPAPAHAAKDKVYSDWRGRAIEGADPVAYFTEGKPVKGSSDFTHDWNGATWYFVSADNRDAFAADPERYAPQYGGYCAWAVSQGYTASVDYESWRIVDDKLYLNYSKDVQQTWEQDIPGNIQKADANWPKVLN